MPKFRVVRRPPAEHQCCCYPLSYPAFSHILSVVADARRDPPVPRRPSEKEAMAAAAARVVVVVAEVAVTEVAVEETVAAEVATNEEAWAGSGEAGEESKLTFQTPTTCPRAHLYWGVTVSAALRLYVCQGEEVGGLPYPQRTPPTQENFLPTRPERLEKHTFPHEIINNDGFNPESGDGSHDSHRHEHLPRTCNLPKMIVPWSGS